MPAPGWTWWPSAHGAVCDVCFRAVAYDWTDGTQRVTRCDAHVPTGAEAVAPPAPVATPVADDLAPDVAAACDAAGVPSGLPLRARLHVLLGMALASRGVR